MMMAETEQKMKKFSWLNSIGVRFIIICFLILLLNIPLGMVKSVTYSRVFLLESTISEISSDWGGKQTIIAPIVSVPVKFTTEQRVYNSEKKVYEKVTNYHEEIFRFLPENLKIEMEILPEMRHRGIFDVLVHSSKIYISGNFEKFDFSFLEGKKYQILWNKAILSIGINPSLVRGSMEVSFADSENLSLNPGSKIDDISGISANVNLVDGQARNFNISFRFNGSGDISFAPLGKKNTFEVVSKWPHPIFKDTFRPENPEISEEGFTAKWDIPYIARDYPQVITSKSDISNIKYKMASVGLYDTMPIYKKSQRLADYGIIFITLTFVMMFLFERKLKKQLHYIQYVVVGLAISLFFLTVMSFSEHLSFALAYALASLIVIMMVSMYIYAALKNKKTALSASLIMAFLYSILYFMLAEGDSTYALLIGTLILLTTIAAIMWETRNINQIKE